MVVCYNRNVYNKISVVVQIGMDLQISGCRCGMKGNMELEDHNGETEDKAKSEKKGGFIDIVVPVLTLMTIINCEYWEKGKRVRTADDPASGQCGCQCGPYGGGGEQ